MLSFTIGKSSMSLFLDGQFYTIDNSHINYQTIREELMKPADERDLERIRANITVRKAIEIMTSGRVTVMSDSILYDGNAIDNYMTRRMLDLLAEGCDITPWVKFMDNVFLNPAEYARGELYEWMERAEMPMTDDGCFLAFKKIRGDYTDCHTGMFDHTPGTILEMDRAACDPVRTNQCSTGFHFCSVGYLREFSGQRVVVVKINPRDVTAIPNDYSFTKGRCCRYEVVAELTKESAAYDKCWRKGVVNLQNPAEFPADVLASIKMAEPDVYEPAVDEVPVPQSAPEAIEEEMTDANKAAPGASPIPTPEQLAIVNAADKSEEVAFTTASGKSYTAAEVETALANAGATRAAAALLGIAESTLRGWKKKLGL